MSEIPSSELEAYGKWLFSRPCEFVKGVTHLDQLPDPQLPEFAFIGRSNVGKSSLINALTGKKNLARTSNTPGRTQEINFFDLEHQLYIVDLPGYGYAEAPKHMVTRWTHLIQDYLRGRVSLKRVFLLLDSRHDPKTSDLEFMKMLDRAAVNYQLILTKCDKVKETQLTHMQSTLEATILKHPACFPEILTTSSIKQQGIDQVKTAIASLLEGNF